MFELTKEFLDILSSAIISEQLSTTHVLPVSYVVCGTCQNTCKGNCLNTCSRVGKGTRR